GAEYDGMMRSAMATGLVDFVLPAEELPEKVVEYFRHVTRDGAPPPDDVRRETLDFLPQVCGVLRARTGHDCSGYKERTMVRRIQRRMQVLQIDGMAEFLERLRREPREVDLLFQDLLIGVTNYFRDKETFAKIETDIIPRIVEGKTAEDTI